MLRGSCNHRLFYFAGARNGERNQACNSSLNGLGNGQNETEAAKDGPFLIENWSADPDPSRINFSLGNAHAVAPQGGKSAFERVPVVPEAGSGSNSAARTR